MIRIRSLVILLALVGLVVPSSAFAANTVSGTILDSTGSPADDARVVVTDRGANPASDADDVALGSAVTADNGTFSISAAGIGANETVLVTVQDAGSAVREETVTTDGSGDRTFTATLVPSGIPSPRSRSSGRRSPRSVPAGLRASSTSRRR